MIVLHKRLKLDVATCDLNGRPVLVTEGLTTTEADDEDKRPGRGFFLKVLLQLPSAHLPLCCLPALYPTALLSCARCPLPLISVHSCCLRPQERQTFP